MSSFTRNIRRANYARRPRAIGAGLALALLSGSALADGAHRFVFTAFSDAAGGDAVVSGHYRAALQEMQTHAIAMNRDPAAVSTNRCVAYSMTLQRQEARQACDAAVRAARDERFSQPAFWTQLPTAGNDYLAVAYANRAVMHWLLREDAAAREDIAKARDLSPRAYYVAANIAAFKVRAEVAQTGMHPVVAQAGTPAPKT